MSPELLREKKQFRTQAIEILKDLSAKHPDIPDYRHLLALCYRDMLSGSFHDDLQPGIEPMDRAIEILQELVDDFPTVPVYRYDLSKTYAMWVDPVMDGHARPKDRSIVEERLQTALEIIEILIAEHPNIPAYIVSEVHMHFRLADCSRRRGELDAAEQHLRKAEDLQSSLVQRFPDVVPHRVWVAVIEGALARLLRDRGRLEDAHSHCQASLAILNGLSQEQRHPPYVRNMFVETYMDLASILRQLGQDREAMEAMHQAEAFEWDR